MSVDKKYKVLIADDESIFREAMKCSFSWNEYDCFVCGEAQNGEDALEQIGRLCPDIILVDINMPFINGLLFIEKAREIMPDLIFVIISGYSEFNYAKEAIRLGVTAYLLKPIDENELAAVLKQAVKLLEERSQDRAEKESLRAAVSEQYLSSQRKNEILIAGQRRKLSKIIELLETIYTYDLDGRNNPECRLLVSVDLMKLLGELLEQETSRKYSSEKIFNPFITLLYRLEMNSIPDYIIELYRNQLIFLYKKSMSVSIQKAIAYIHDHFQEPELSVDCIAETVYLNYYHLCSQFKKETGMTVNYYLMNIRMFQSVIYLVSGKSIETTAIEVGIPDVKYFSKCFKKVFGVSPRVLR